MNKKEALQKIKELQEYIEECDKRPDIAKGQLWRHDDGDVYMVTNINLHSNKRFNMVGVCDIEYKSEGSRWTSTDEGFGSDESDFNYIGMATDLLTLRKT